MKVKAYCKNQKIDWSPITIFLIPFVVIALVLIGCHLFSVDMIPHFEIARNIFLGSLVVFGILAIWKRGKYELQTEEVEVNDVFLTTKIYQIVEINGEPQSEKIELVDPIACVSTGNVLRILNMGEVAKAEKEVAKAAKAAKAEKEMEIEKQ